MHDKVERRRDLLANGAHGQIEARHEHHRLDPGERIAWRVGVDGAERPIVTRVHGLEHVESLSAANLADDDAIRSHAERVAYELSNRDLALPLDVLRSCLEAKDMLLIETQLGGVLDRDDTVGFRDRGREGVEESRLARTRPAGDEHIQFRKD